MTILATVSQSNTRIARALLIAVLVVLTVRSLRRDPIPRAELLRRVPRCIAGLALFGFGIALFFASKLGVPGWDVLHAGIAKRVGVPAGLVTNLVGLAILPLWIPLKQRVGLGTILNTLEIGIVLDLVRPHLLTPDTFLGRLAMSLVGLLCVGIASGIYIGSGLGNGPRDGVMMGLKRLGLSVRLARFLIEATTLTVGVLLGGRTGIGTVIFLVGIGPIVQWTLQRTGLPPLTRPESAAAVDATPTQPST